MDVSILEEFIGGIVEKRMTKILDERDKKHSQKNSEWVSLTEACAIIGKGKQTLWKYCREKCAIRENELSPRKKVYNRKDLESFRENSNYRYILES